MFSLTAAADPLALLTFMLGHPDRYWQLLMTLTPSEKEDFDKQLASLSKALLDAKDPQFKAVFPQEILAQGQHLVHIWLSETMVRDPGVPYRERLLGPSRRVVVGLPSKALPGLDELLGSYLSRREKTSYDRIKRSSQKPAAVDPKPNSFALWIVQGIHPEPTLPA